ncbi:unnamed protein product [Toxocara canis]|uniref:Transposase n=1 Tax=Toxocara canis TaxID=6265 RepID=A0A183TVP9_TOXCA|nr:unnamed protein product [Toxocara canis]
MCCNRASKVMLAVRQRHLYADERIEDESIEEQPHRKRPQHFYGAQPTILLLKGYGVIEANVSCNTVIQKAVTVPHHREGYYTTLR